MPAVDKNSSNLVSYNLTLSDNHLINALIGGSKWGGIVGTGATIYYSFPSTKSLSYWDSDVDFGYGSVDSELSGFKALTTVQQAAATSALKSWTNVANITIQKVTETVTQVGDIRFSRTSASIDEGTYAFAYYPAINNPIGGDVWLNATPPGNGGNYAKGASGYHTLLHEIGHALGLDHSFVDEANTEDIGLDFEYEYFQYSVMSYSDTPFTFDNGYSGYYPTTPMMFDIAAMQYLYGANMSYKTGNDVYTFNGTSKYYQTIWDAGGIDTIKYVSTKGGYIDLRDGYFSELGQSFKVGSGDDIYTQFQTVGIAFNAIIENAIGSAGNDFIIGNSTNNSVLGGAGNDWIEAGLGNDTLDGGTGVDTLYGGAGDDTFVIDIKQIGSGLVSSINYLDTYFDESGTDTVILRGSAVTNQVFEITLTDIENIDISKTGSTKLFLAGNDQNNVMVGNAFANSIMGGGGNDTLNGGAGIDTLNGGAGDDTYILNSQAEVALILENGGTADTVQSSISISIFSRYDVEQLVLTGTGAIYGSANDLNNRVVGNVAANALYGYAGQDSLEGGGGKDVLVGGLGQDTLTGGLGADRFDFNSWTETTVSSSDLITDFSRAQLDKIDLSTMDANNGTALNDAFKFIGAVAFSVVGQVRFVDGIVSADMSGDLIADFEIALLGVTSLTAADFIL